MALLFALGKEGYSDIGNNMEDLENTTLNESSQTQKDRRRMIPLL